MSQTIISHSGVEYIDPGRLVDGELELVVPDPYWFDDLLASCHHPMTVRDMPLQARTTREHLQTFVRANPGGFSPGDAQSHNVPSYTYWLRIHPGFRPAIPMAGSISLRLGYNDNLEMYLGHIGYHVLPAARGHHYALRACRLMLGVARLHHFKTLWITTNPDNIASRKTCDQLGAVLVDTVAVPRMNPLYAQGDRYKCRYRIEI